MTIKYYTQEKKKIIELCISTEDERYVEHNKDTVSIRIQRIKIPRPKGTRI